MNNYRERQIRYQQGKMTTEEAEIFEKELADAQALIEGFLDNDFETLPPLDFQETFPNEEKRIKKKIRWRIIKLTTNVIIAIGLLAAIGRFVTPKIMDNYYYNPMENQVIDTKYMDGHQNSRPSNSELYSRVENQLGSSPYRFINTQITKIGAAKYEMNKTYFDDFRGTFFFGTNILNKESLSFVESTNVPTSLIYGSHQNVQEPVSEQSELIQKIKQLPQSAWLKLNLTFSKEKTWDEVRDFLKKHPNLAVYTATIGNNEQQLRFSNLEKDVQYSEDFKTTIHKQYPELLRNISKSTTATQVAQHLQSSAQYLLDHPEDNLMLYDPSFSKAQKQDLQAQRQTNYQDLLSTIKNKELTFTQIEVGLAKTDFEPFVTPEQFAYVQLQDVALIKMN